MLIYCNERRLELDPDISIMDSINNIDIEYNLVPFKERNQIVIDSNGKQILDLERSPRELNLIPYSTIYIVNRLDER